MHEPTRAKSPRHPRTSPGDSVVANAARAEPTREQFDAYRSMFRYFNDALFGGSLPEVVLNFSRHARSYGFFAPERWQHAKSAEKTHEISINPDTLSVRDPRQVASTLVHEMCHLWQHVFGSPPRRAYHDRQWASKMESVGLIPSSTGAPGGKRVGQHMTHYIADDGAFAKAFAAMPAELLLPWRSSPLAPARPRRGGAAGGGEPAKRDPSKLKYTCTACGANVWGKPDLVILCGTCGVPFVCAAARHGDELDGDNGSRAQLSLPLARTRAPARARA